MPSKQPFYGATSPHPALAWLSGPDVEPRLGHGVGHCVAKPGPRLAMRLGSQSRTSYITWEGTDYREDGFLWLDFTDDRWILSPRPGDFWQLQPYRRGAPPPPRELWRTIALAIVDAVNAYTATHPEFPAAIERSAVLEHLEAARQEERVANNELAYAQKKIDELTARLARLGNDAS